MSSAALEEEPLFGPRPCPECAVGKCTNCPNQSWDDEMDIPIPCPCASAGHPEHIPVRSV